jgi:hypothetical protein
MKKRETSSTAAVRKPLRLTAADVIRVRGGDGADPPATHKNSEGDSPTLEG